LQFFPFFDRGLELADQFHLAVNHLRIEGLGRFSCGFLLFECVEFFRGLLQVLGERRHRLLFVLELLFEIVHGELV